MKEIINEERRQKEKNKERKRKKERQQKTPHKYAPCVALMGWFAVWCGVE
jgi:hypothetical protein